MIGYVTIGTNDIQKARAFYDALMPELGAKRLMQMDDYNDLTMYGTSMTDPQVSITRPYNGEPAHAGNGNMVALFVNSRAKVDVVHAKAISLGATDEGAPGLRGDPNMNFYGAYFRDPDSNKLAVFSMGPA
jgi:catechol 2,3-dioxygenase-like lactoylglutathione lyase family enzyme